MREQSRAGLLSQALTGGPKGAHAYLALLLGWAAEGYLAMVDCMSGRGMLVMVDCMRGRGDAGDGGLHEREEDTW